MIKKLTLFLFFAATTSLSHAQQANPFSFEGAYVGDFYGNAAGGLKTGVGFMGMGNLKMGFDTGKARWWRGGSFFVNGATIHGKSLSGHYLGDLQVASNIDAGTHIYLHELWFGQRIGNVSLKVGLQDLNADFLVSECGSEFVNSSFGVAPVLSVNVPVPIFPLTGLGFSAAWDIGEKFRWQAAVFDGEQTPFERNPNNLNWHLDKNEGLLAITELHGKFGRGTYKFGTYYHSGHEKYGFYAIGDQTVLERENHHLHLFTQIAVAPKSHNEANYYIGLGANLFGVFSRRERDAVGLAVAHAGLHRTSHKHETAIEFYYKYHLNGNIALQPDVQYIVNPSGTDVKRPNALVGLLRVHIDF